MTVRTWTEADIREALARSGWDERPLPEHVLTLIAEALVGAKREQEGKAR